MANFRRPGRRTILGTLGVVAVVTGGVLAGNQWIGGGGGGGGGTPTRYPNVTGNYVTNANTWVTPSGGSDGTCTFHSTAVAYSSGIGCATVDKAATLCQQNLNNCIVGMPPGSYTPSQEQNGYMYYGDDNPPLTNAVTIECQTGAAADSVDFVDTGTTVFYGVKNVTIDGSCFHIRQPQLGLAGTPATPPCNPSNGNLQTGPITFNGTHFDSFDIIRTCGATLKNVQVGPYIACWASGANAGVGECQGPGNPLYPVEQWYYDHHFTGCSLGINQTEPYIRNDATNTVLDNVLFTGLNTADPNTPGPCSAQGIHQGGILIWTVTNLTVQNTEWRNVFLYCMELNDSSTNTGIIWQNNICGHTVNSNEAYPSTLFPARINHAGGSNCQDGAGGYYFGPGNSKNIFVTNSIWRYNTYFDCFQVTPDPSNSLNTNVRVIGNIFGGVSGGGAITCNTVTGVTYDYNVSGNGDAACGSHAGTMAGSPFQNAGAEPQVLLPVNSSPPLNYVPCGSGDAQLAFDILNVSRPASTNCTAGVYETITG